MVGDFCVFGRQLLVRKSFISIFHWKPIAIDFFDIWSGGAECILVLERIIYQID